MQLMRSINPIKNWNGNVFYACVAENLHQLTTAGNIMLKWVFITDWQRQSDNNETRISIESKIWFRESFSSHSSVNTEWIQLDRILNENWKGSEGKFHWKFHLVTQELSLSRKIETTQFVKSVK